MQVRTGGQIDRNNRKRYFYTCETYTSRKAIPYPQDGKEWLIKSFCAYWTLALLHLDNQIFGSAPELFGIGNLQCQLTLVILLQSI